MKNDLDNKIIKYFEKETEDISVPEDMFFKVRSKIMEKEERGFLNMKIGFLKVKTALAVAAICVLTTATCGAVTNGFSSWNMSSSKATESTDFPSKEKVNDTVGFDPKYVEKFDGGFEFKSFNYTSNQVKSDSEDTTVEGKGTTFEYSRDNSNEKQYLYASAIKIDSKYMGDLLKDSEVYNCDDIDVYYHTFKHKSVPEGYIPTAEEEEEVKNGTLQIGYGDKDEEINIDNMQSVTWYEDGILYDILNNNYTDVTKEEMVKMAKDVINKR